MIVGEKKDEFFLAVVMIWAVSVESCIFQFLGFLNLNTQVTLYLKLMLLAPQMDLESDSA